MCQPHAHPSLELARETGGALTKSQVKSEKGVLMLRNVYIPENSFLALLLIFDWSSSSVLLLFIMINLQANFLGTVGPPLFCSLEATQ